MRSCLTIVFLCLSSLHLFATEVSVDSKIDLVTVYLNGAEVARTADVNIPEGKHVLRFTELSPDINQNSIQVLAADGVRVLSVSSKMNYLSSGQDNKQVRILNDSIKIYEIRMSDIDNESDALNQEKQMILSNKQIKGNNAVMDLAILKETATYFRTRILAINMSVSDLTRKRIKLNENLANVRRQLNEISSKRVPVSELLVSVEVKRAMKSTFSLRYLVNKAGWSPVYDLFTADLDEPLILKYKAMAYNNTGIDWNDVKMVLSTADPNQSASRPKMSSWYLDFEGSKQFNEYQGYLNSRSNVMQGKAAGAYEALDNKNLIQDQSSGVYLEAISVNELSVDFEIKDDYSIPSDGKPYTIDIDEFQLEASYLHYAVPKVDKDAFLLAQITGWEDLNLIEGPMNVYQGKNYVGLSNLDTRTLEDTLNLSLGRDKRVLVTRTKKKDFSSKKFLGSNKKVTQTYEVNIKNNRNKQINIELLDQLPISKNSEIEVIPGELSKAIYVESTGQLKWVFSLAPGESKKITMSYTIKYPKNRVIKLQKQRVMYAPRF